MKNAGMSNDETVFIETQAGEVIEVSMVDEQLIHLFLRLSQIVARRALLHKEAPRLQMF